MTESLMERRWHTGHSDGMGPSRDISPGDRALTPQPNASLRSEQDLYVTRVDDTDREFDAGVIVVAEYSDVVPPSLAATHVSLGQVMNVLARPVPEVIDVVPPSPAATTVTLGPARPVHHGAHLSVKPGRVWAGRAAWLAAGMAVVAATSAVVTLLDGNDPPPPTTALTQSAAPDAAATPATVQSQRLDGTGQSDRMPATAPRVAAVDLFDRPRHDDDAVAACAAFTGRTPSLPSSHTLVLASPDPDRSTRRRLQPVDGWVSLSPSRPWTAGKVLQGWDAGRDVKVQLLDLPVATVRKAMAGGTSNGYWTASSLPAGADVLQTVVVKVAPGTAGCPAG